MKAKGEREPSTYKYMELLDMVQREESELLIRNEQRQSTTQTAHSKQLLQNKNHDII